MMLNIVIFSSVFIALAFIWRAIYRLNNVVDLEVTRLRYELNVLYTRLSAVEVELDIPFIPNPIDRDQSEDTYHYSDVDGMTITGENNDYDISRSENG